MGTLVRYSHAQVARVCYAAARQLAIEQGLPRSAAWERLDPDEQGWWVQAVARARMGMLPEQIYEAQRQELADDGWLPGPVVSHRRRTHPGLVPWSALDIKRRIQLQVLQMTATALTVDVPPVWEDMGCVTAPLSDI